MVELANLEICPRYNGPQGSGNGGITAGLLAQRLAHHGAVQVTLRLPPPLATMLRLEQDGRHVRAFAGTDLVAEAEVVSGAPTAASPIDPVPPVSFPAAVAAAARYDGFGAHPFPTCFVCGTDRPDGLALFAGAVDPSDRANVAAPWFVPSSSGLSDPVLVWAALDCPGGWAIDLVGRHAVLGRMTAQVFDRAQVDEHCVVVAQCDGWQGRKAFSRSSLYGADGRLIGAAAQVWIELARD